MSRTWDAPVLAEVLQAVFEGSAPPVCAWIGVAALANAGLLIEIESTAVVD